MSAERPRGPAGALPVDAFAVLLDALAERVVDRLLERLSAAGVALPKRYATAKDNPTGCPRAFLEAHRAGAFPTFKQGREIAADWNVVETWMRSRPASPAAVARDAQRAQNDGLDALLDRAARPRRKSPTSRAA